MDAVERAKNIEKLKATVSDVFSTCLRIRHLSGRTFPASSRLLTSRNFQLDKSTINRTNRMHSFSLTERFCSSAVKCLLHVSWCKYCAHLMFDGGDLVFGVVV